MCYRTIPMLCTLEIFDKRCNRDLGKISPAGGRSASRQSRSCYSEVPQGVRDASRRGCARRSEMGAPWSLPGVAMCLSSSVPSPHLGATVGLTFTDPCRAEGLPPAALPVSASSLPLVAPTPRSTHTPVPNRDPAAASPLPPPRRPLTPHCPARLTVSACLFLPTLAAFPPAKPVTKVPPRRLSE